jgi:3-dehydroquinate dehydratase
MTAVVSKVAQEIVWVQDLSNLYVLDTVVLNATAKTEVNYAVSDESVATIEGDRLIAHRAGEVVVYAYAVENDVYEADTLSMTAVVSKVAQEIVWVQDLTNLHVSDTVVLNATAMTEVSYAVSDASVASLEGDKLIAHRAGEVVVYAYAAESEVYEADTLVRTIMVAPLAQEIVWTLDSLEMTVGDTLILNAVATSGLAVSYVLDIEGVVLLENNTLVAQSAGEVVVTAVQEGDNRYMAAEEVSYRIVVVETVNAALDHVTGGKQNAYKVIRNGQIFIIKGGHVYNVFGEMIK